MVRFIADSLESVNLMSTLDLNKRECRYSLAFGIGVINQNNIYVPYGTQLFNTGNNKNTRSRFSNNVTAPTIGSILPNDNDFSSAIVSL